MTKTETLSTLRTELRNARSAIDAIRHQSDERLLLLERYALENAELTAMLNDLFMWRREMKEKLSAIIIRNVPESVRRELKARAARLLVRETEN
jgi:hypothetical protein